MSSSLAGFIIIILLAIFYREINLGERQRDDIFTVHRPPKNLSELLNFNSLTITNKTGIISINKHQNHYFFSNRKKLPVNKNLLFSLLEKLQEIKVKYVHQKNELNLENFSLSYPSLKIEWVFNDIDNDDLSIGATNSLDETTFITLHSESRIFQTEKLNNNLTQIDWRDILDPRVFPLDFSEIQRLELYRIRGSNRKMATSLKIENERIYKNQRDISEKVFPHLSLLLSQKAHTIIDEVNPSIEEQLSNYLQNIIYEFEITLNNGETLVYKISSIIPKSIHLLKIEKAQQMIVIPAHLSTPYIVSKDLYFLLQKLENI